MFVYIRSAALGIVVMQKLVLQQSKSVTAKCTETLSPPPSIQFSLHGTMYIRYVLSLTYKVVYKCTPSVLFHPYSWEETVQRCIHEHSLSVDYEF